jgi:alpha/beta superfamily hydrolase
MEFLRQKFNVVHFDFSGSGLSEGEFTTLGMGEKYDIGALLNHIHRMYSVGEFYLWGRSMGAVSILLLLENLIDFDEYENLPYKICGLVLDSPFKNSKELVRI